ncbi:lonely Cys domain-containing protein, partial [Streptomyces sp. NPDC102441]|uniref:lonely Cys domain-containing protein n=1 Tax=Streptomyces sp. NPDC102441 TaxID=3366176 RepID=UPI0037F46E19
MSEALGAETVVPTPSSLDPTAAGTGSLDDTAGVGQPNIPSTAGTSVSAPPLTVTSRQGADDAFTDEFAAVPQDEEMPDDGSSPGQEQQTSPASDMAERPAAGSGAGSRGTGGGTGNEDPAASLAEDTETESDTETEAGREAASLPGSAEHRTATDPGTLPTSTGAAGTAGRGDAAAEPGQTFETDALDALDGVAAAPSAHAVLPDAAQTPAAPLPGTGAGQPAASSGTTPDGETAAVQESTGLTPDEGEQSAPLAPLTAAAAALAGGPQSGASQQRPQTPADAAVTPPAGGPAESVVPSPQEAVTPDTRTPVSQGPGQDDSTQGTASEMPSSYRPVRTESEAPPTEFDDSSSDDGESIFSADSDLSSDRSAESDSDSDDERQEALAANGTQAVGGQGKGQGKGKGKGKSKGKGKTQAPGDDSDGRDADAIAPDTGTPLSEDPGQGYAAQRTEAEAPLTASRYVRHPVSTDAPTASSTAGSPESLSTDFTGLLLRSFSAAGIPDTTSSPPVSPGAITDGEYSDDSSDDESMAEAFELSPANKEWLAGPFGPDFESDDSFYAPLLATTEWLERLRQADAGLRGGPLDLDALARRVLVLDTAAAVTLAQRTELFRVAMDEAVESADSLAALAAFHLQRTGALSPEYVITDPSGGFTGRDYEGTPNRRLSLDLTLSGKATQSDGDLNFDDVGAADWSGAGKPPPVVIKAKGDRDHVMVLGRRVPTDVFVELMAIDPELAALPAGRDVLLAISHAGAGRPELPRRVADRLGRDTWSTNGAVHVHAQPEDPSLPHVVYLEFPDLRPENPRKLLPDWICSPPGLLPDTAENEADLAGDRELLSNTIVVNNRSRGRSYFGGPDAEGYMEQDRHAAEAEGTWHWHPGTGMTEDPDGVPFGKDVYFYGVHGRPGVTWAPTKKDPENAFRDGAFSRVLRRSPSLRKLAPQSKVVALGCTPALREGTNPWGLPYGPAPFVPDPLAITSQLQHVSNETGRVSYGASTAFSVSYQLATRKWAYVLNSDARGRRGRWVECRPEPTGAALDQLARDANLHTGDGPVSVEDRARALRLARALRIAFGAAIEDDATTYLELLRGIGALENMRAADPALNRLGPFTMDLFERAARVGQDQLDDSQTLVDSDPRSDTHRDLRNACRDLLVRAANSPTGAVLTKFIELPHVLTTARRLHKSTPILEVGARMYLRLDAGAVVGEPELSRMFWAMVKAEEWSARHSDSDLNALTAKVLHLNAPDPARRDGLHTLATLAAAAGRDLDNPTALAAFHLETLGALDPRTRLLDSEGNATGRNWAGAAANPGAVDTARVAVPQGVGQQPPWLRPAYLVQGVNTEDTDPDHLLMDLPGGRVRVPWAEVGELLHHDMEMNRLPAYINVALTQGVAAAKPPVGPAGSDARKKDPRGVISKLIGRPVVAARHGMVLHRANATEPFRPHVNAVADLVTIGPIDERTPEEAQAVGTGWSSSEPRGLPSPDVSTPDTEAWLPFADADGVAAHAPSAHTFTFAPSIAPVPDPGVLIGQDSAMDVPTAQSDSDDTASSLDDRSDTESMFSEAGGVSSNVSDYGSDDDARPEALTAGSPPAVGGRDGTGKGTAQLLGGDPDGRDAVGLDARMLSSEEDPEQGRAERGAASEVSPLSSAVSEELGPRSSGFAEMSFTPSLPGFVDDDVLMVDAPAEPSTPIGIREWLEDLYGSDISSNEDKRVLYDALLAAVDLLDRLWRVEPVLRDGPFDLDAVVRHVLMLDAAVEVTPDHRAELSSLALDDTVKSASSFVALSALHLQGVGAVSPGYAMETLDNRIWGRDLEGSSFPVLDLTLSGTAIRRSDGTLEFGEVGPADWHRPGEDPPFVIRAKGGYDHVMVFGRRVSIDVFVELMAIDPAVIGLPAG